MLIESARFGQVEIDDNSIITFPNGIPGFEDRHRFVIMRCEQTEPIQWMQCVDDAYLALPTINPFILVPEYHIDVNDEELSVIETCDEEEIILFSIMVIPEDLQDMTVNLMAPVLVNIKKMLGTQVLLDRGEMPMRFPAYELLCEYYRKEANANACSDEKTE